MDANSDYINHPSHYQTPNGLETIDVIEAFTSDLNGIQAVCTGNILKYICRWKKKNGLEDLKKARWYLDRLSKSVENGIYPEYMSCWVGAVQDTTKEDVIYANGKYYVAKE